MAAARSSFHGNDMTEDTKTPRHPSPGPLRPKGAELLAIITCVVPFFTSIGVAIGHHYFLSSIDGHALGYLGSEEFWARSASNAFAISVAVLLGIAAASALTQGIWRMAQTQYIPIRTLDELFSLPSPLSTILLLLRPYKFGTILLLSISAYIKLLALVSTIAPNVLSVGPRHSTLQVPVPDLSRFMDSDVSSDLIQLSSYLMATNTEALWRVPYECYPGCSFRQTYTAPSISCRELDSNDIILQPFDSRNFNSSTGWSFYDSQGSQSANANLTLTYIPFEAHSSGSNVPNVEPLGSVNGIICSLVNSAPYEAEFSFIRNVKTISISPSFNSSPRPCGTSSDPCPNGISPAGGLWKLFYSTFGGTLSLSTAGQLGDDLVVNIAPHDDESAYPLTPNLYNVRRLFSYLNDTTSHQIQFTAKADNMSRALEELWANVTLGLLLQSNDTRLASATLEGGVGWVYDTKVLKLIYLPSLVIGLVFVAMGIYSVISTRIALEITFSAFFISMQREQMQRDNQQSQVALRKIGSPQREVVRPLLSQTSSSLPSYPSDTYLLEGKDRTARRGNQTLPANNTSLWIPWMISGLSMFALLLAIGHHIFLSVMNGRNASQSQFWIKSISNAFAHASVYCMATSATYSLLQMIWRKFTQRGMKIGTIDELFGLPNLKALVFLVSSIGRGGILMIYLVGLTIQCLVVVTIVAPNALTTAPSPLSSNRISTPSLNLSANLGLPPSTFYADPWSTLVTQLTLNPLNETWSTSTCGPACSFEMEYQAPALTCRDLAPNEFTVTHYDPATLNDTEQNFYNFGLSIDMLHPINVTTQWNNATVPGFYVNYEPSTTTISSLGVTTVDYNGPAVGTFCTCGDATYQASFQYIDNVISVNNTIVSYRSAFSNSCAWNSPSSLSEECINYSSNSVALCNAFTNNFGFQIGWSSDGEFQMYGGQIMPSVVVNLSPIVNWNGSSTESSLGTTTVLSSKYLDLKQGLRDLFSNVTLGLLPLLNQTDIVDAKVWDGRTIWVFDWKILWAVYIVPLIFVFAVAGRGLFCIRTSGLPLDNKLSTVAATTDSAELGDLCRNTGEYEHIISSKIVFVQDEGRFVLARSSVRE